MAVIAIDLGGTKLASAIFTDEGRMQKKHTVSLAGRRGKAVGALIGRQIKLLLDFASSTGMPLKEIGVCVPGVYYLQSGKVWAPNIPQWQEYPLLDDIRSILGDQEIQVKIDSDRACYILGEAWQGTARGCTNAIFLAVGTGIGAGIMIDGKILRGQTDIAGATGWMALNRPYRAEYKKCGCFEYHASGEGIANVAREMIAASPDYSGLLADKDAGEITSHDVFEALETWDPIAKHVLDQCIEHWGMAVANLVSLFNPEKVIFGGGVFGPAARFIGQIREEARKWAQPVGIEQVKIEVSVLGGDAGLIGAARLALM